MAKVAIMGFGTVGSGVYEIIKNSNFKDCYNEQIDVKYILDIRDFDDKEIQPLLTKNFDDILNDTEIKAVAEVLGGLHPAYEFTKQLLEKGISVVSSNKELVATYGAELLELAEKNNANYMFEASVGGGIPIIRPLSVCLKANKIERIAGILNGTTNYILDEMFTKGKDFDSALKDAQDKGYAEKNPAADIEGHDACRKIAILSSMAWGKFVDYADLPTEGITKITKTDVQYAENLNSVIKLIGYADIDDNGKIYASVSPMLISDKMQLSHVDGVFNAVTVRGNYLGDAMFYGQGAGKEATASAVVADILDCAKHFNCEKHNIKWETENDIFADFNSKSSSFFVRCHADKEDILKTFEKAEFVDGLNNENAFIIKNITKNELDEKASKLNNVISILKILEA